MKVVAFADIKSLVTPLGAISAVEAAFAAYSSGQANVPPVQHLEMPYLQGGALHIKSGHVRSLPFCVVKVASTFPANKPPLASINGALLVIRTAGEPGEFIALLEDRAWITQARTAAAGAIAARYLSRPGAQSLCVVGTGTQARLQAVTIAESLPTIRRISVWGRSITRAEACSASIRACMASPDDFDIHASASLADAVSGADIVVTATYSEEPIVQSAWVAPGALVVGLGADSATKRELSQELIAAADVLVVDSRSQNLVLGEIAEAVRNGAVSIDGIVELGEILSSRETGAPIAARRSANQRIVCKLTGIAAQEIFVCNDVLTRLRVLPQTELA